MLCLCFVRLEGKGGLGGEGGGGRGGTIFCNSLEVDGGGYEAPCYVLCRRVGGIYIRPSLSVFTVNSIERRNQAERNKIFYSTENVLTKT